jgi:hypothetical protein
MSSLNLKLEGQGESLVVGQIEKYADRDLQDYQDKTIKRLPI